MSVAQFVAGVDRLLTRGHGLFPAGGGDGEVFAAGGGDKPAVPPPPGGSGLSGGAGAAGGSYGQTRSVVSGVDVDTAAASTDGGAVADAGRAGSGAIRDQARAVAAVSAPLGSSPAGAQLVVATMDQHMEAMQRQLDTTTAQNRLLALRLRELAAAYRGGAGGGGGSPLSALSGLSSMSGLGSAGGGLSGLSGLAGLPGSLMGAHGGLSGRGGGGAIAGTQVGDVSGRDLPPGVGNEKGLQKFTLLAERAVSAAFPEIKDIGGVRADSLKWHPNGQAIDVMIPNPTSAHGKALGNAILRFALQHSHEFSLNHVIWQQTMYNPDGSSSRMEDRGSPTQNHMDHVHIATNGGGFPHGGEVYRL